MHLLLYIMFISKSHLNIYMQMEKVKKSHTKNFFKFDIKQKQKSSLFFFY